MRQLQRLADRNVDIVKVWVDDAGGRLPKIEPELSAAVIDEARQHGLSVVAHVFYLMMRRRSPEPASPDSSTAFAMRRSMTS